MSLSQRIIWGVLMSLVCSALLGAASLVGVRRMSGHFDTAAEHYDQLRGLYEIGYRAAMIRQLLSLNAPDSSAIGTHLTAAALELRTLSTATAGERRGEVPPDIGAKVAAIAKHMERIGEHCQTGEQLRAASSEVNAALGLVADLSGEAQSNIIENRHLAAERAASTDRFIGILFVIIFFVVVVTGGVLHRSVLKPIRSLETAVAQLSQAEFTHRIPESGVLEFRQLIAQFNQMSNEIERLHRSMQSQVEIKSRQIIRSEQLATVGYLAAGLAHEINNPLGIITGYAESTLRRLKSPCSRLDEGELRERAESVLTVICDEAFRCRDITRGLLDMAHPHGMETKPVRVSPLVSRVTKLVRGLSIARDREIALCVDKHLDDLTVDGDESQLVQVLVNIFTNALESCEPVSGRVVITIHRRAHAVWISVEDNGCGMTTEALAHAFEPFFTDKARRGLSGSGLGLSVSHSIAERHGGAIYAHSDGPGLGSQVTLELPIMVHETRIRHAC